MKDDADAADASGWLAAQFGEDSDATAEPAAADAGHVSRRAARRHGQSARGEKDAPPDTAPPAGPVPGSPAPAVPGNGASPALPYSPAAQSAGGFRWNLGGSAAQPPEELPGAGPEPAFGGAPFETLAERAPQGTEGFDPAPLGTEGFDPAPLGTEGFDPESLGAEGFDPEPQRTEGFQSEPRGAEGFAPEPWGAEGFAREPLGVEGFEPEPLGAEGFEPAPLRAGPPVVDPFLPDDPSLPEPVLPHPGRALPTELFSAAVPGEPTVPLVSRRTFLPAETHIPVWPDAAPEPPTALLPAGVAGRDPDDSPLAALFREHDRNTGQYAAPTEAYGIQRSPDFEAPASDRRPSGPGGSNNRRILLWTAGVLLAVAVLVALFFAGTALPQMFGAASPAVLASPSPSTTATPSPSPSLSPSASPSPQLMAAAAGPRPPGDYPWDQLAGGECLAGYTSPWAEDFTVVDCAAKHPAQLLQRGVFGPDDSSAYPGVKALQAKSVTLCSASKLLDYGAAGAYRDLQVAASYAATKEEWAAGHRDYFCFASRASGEDLTGSVASAR